MLKNINIQLVFPDDFFELKNFDVDETGKTFTENAILKAKTYSEKVNILCIADDSGIIIDGMNGLPGVHSNRWFDGTPDERNAEVLRRLDLKDSDEKSKVRTARYVTAVCYYDPNSKKYKVFEGVVEGSIGTEIIGNEGFDYDRIFIPKGYNETFAQLGNKFKNKISQRAKAYKKLKKYLKKVDG